jgi:DGQHR domain-containing protein
MPRRKSEDPQIALRAVRTLQAETAIYAFFLPGPELLRIAEISRVQREPDGALQGFQRRAIRSHVQSIVEFLDAGPALFPNAVILALSPRVRFTAARGGKPDGDLRASEAGTLRIPLPSDGTKAAWIVDGQQRSIALSQAKNRDLQVPVVAFVSEDLAVHREQFILVNKAKPLDPRLIDELLPEVEAALPRDLSIRKLPSELVNLLNSSPTSPFAGLIKRPSVEATTGVIIDSALAKAIRASINSPLGALAPYKAGGNQPADVAAMYRVLVAYWSAVKAVFADAWGREPSQSRLMHSAGVLAMGVLMDRIMSRARPGADLQEHATESLLHIAPHCRWTSGRWPDIQREWSDIQAVTRDIRLLTDQLARLDHRYAFASKAA